MVLEGSSSEGDTISRSVARIALGKDSCVCIFKPASKKKQSAHIHTGLYISVTHIIKSIKKQLYHHCNKMKKVNLYRSYKVTSKSHESFHETTSVLP